MNYLVNLNIQNFFIFIVYGAEKNGFLQRVKNGEYMINPHIAYKGSRADKESLLAEYNQIKRPNKVSK